MTTIAIQNTNWYLNCSWGLMRSSVNQYVPFTVEGAKDDPQTYTRLKELTTA